MQNLQNYFNTLKLIELIIKWKKHITIIVSIAVLLSIIISSPWVIKPRYKSTAIIYPSNLMPYSTETPTEQLLQIGRSNEIRDSVIEKFNLYNHYDIDTSSQFHRTKLIRKYQDFVTITKSEFESVEINVIDTKPDTARLIALSIIDFLNNKIRTLHREKITELVMSLHNQIRTKHAQMDSINIKLDTLRIKHKLLDYTIQTKEATKEMVKNGANASAGSVLKNLQNYGGQFLLLGGTLSSFAAISNQLQAQYEQANNDLTKEFTYTNIIASPEVPEKKIYPIRWMIVVGTALASFILSVLIIAFIESSKIDQQDNTK